MCAGDCENACSNTCSDSCLTLCSATCTATCADNCYMTCSSMCAGDCETACSAACSATCSNSCAAECSQTCSTACYGACSDTCSGFCTATCSDNCDNACDSTCSGTCSTICIEECAQTCSSDCVGTCAGLCSDGCGGSCAETCLESCNNDCSNSCSDACGGTCAEACSASCAYDCSTLCTTTCITTCSATCADYPGEGPSPLGTLNLVVPDTGVEGTEFTVQFTCANAHHYAIYIVCTEANVNRYFYHETTTNPDTYTVSFIPLLAGIYTVTAAARNTPDENFDGTDRQQTSSVIVIAQGLAPGNPVSLTGTHTDDSVTLSWEAAVGATGYNIYRGGTSVGSSTDTTFTEEDLLPVATYTYTVKSRNTAEVESNGVTISVTIPVPSGTIWVREYLRGLNDGYLTDDNIGYENAHVTVSKTGTAYILNIAGLIHGGDGHVYASPSNINAAYNSVNPQLHTSVSGDTGYLENIHELTRTSSGDAYIKVISGDTLSEISELVCDVASRYGEIAALNGLVNPGNIHIGWYIKVTGIITQAKLDEAFPGQGMCDPSIINIETTDSSAIVYTINATGKSIRVLYQGIQVGGLHTILVNNTTNISGLEPDRPYIFQILEVDGITIDDTADATTQGTGNEVTFTYNGKTIKLINPNNNNSSDPYQSSGNTDTARCEAPDSKQ